MQTIWKFVLDRVSLLEREQYTARMPALSEIIHCSMAGENFVVWARVDTEAKLKLRKFLVYGTGHQIPDDLIGRIKHVDTVFEQHPIFKAQFVWHVFELFGEPQ